MFEQRCLLIGDYISAHAAARPNAPAVVDDDVTLTWKEFDSATRSVGAAFAAIGCRPGDRVGVVMSNCTAMTEIFFGTMRWGFVVVPLNPLISDDAIARLLADADVAAIVATPDQAERLDPLELTIPRIVTSQERQGWICFEGWRDSQPSLRPPPVDPLSPCNIIYSSGTTGKPKGIVHTHKGRVDWAYDLALALRYNGSPRTLILTGLHSNISWASMLPTLLLGGTLIIQKAFEPGAALAAIACHSISNLSAVPVQFQRLLDHEDFASADTSSMRAMMCCGSALPLRVKQRLLSDFRCGVIELYGLTEGIVTTLDPEEAPHRLASVGRPIQGSEIRLIDTGGTEVEPGQPGEIVGKSRFLMRGYWNDPHATAETTWVDEDGEAWLRSGDIGRCDEEGYLYIVDRKKDMILSGGQNVFPADIEAVLHEHPQVAECAVIGIPSEVWGETPLALIVPAPGADIDLEGLRTWVNGRVGKQQRVQAIELRESLPRNANGKVLKTELRACYWAPGRSAN